MALMGRDQSFYFFHRNRDLVKYKLGHLESDDVATVIKYFWFNLIYYKTSFPDSKFIIVGWVFIVFNSHMAGFYL